MTFAEALAIAEAQYQLQCAAYVAALSPEQLEAIQRNAAKPRPVGRPIRTEREVLIEIIKKTDDTDDRIAYAILAAGFKRGAA